MAGAGGYALEARLTGGYEDLAESPALKLVTNAYLQGDPTSSPDKSPKKEAGLIQLRFLLGLTDRALGAPSVEQKGVRHDRDRAERHGATGQSRV